VAEIRFVYVAALLGEVEAGDPTQWPRSSHAAGGTLQGLKDCYVGRELPTQPEAMSENRVPKEIKTAKYRWELTPPACGSSASVASSDRGRSAGVPAKRHCRILVRRMLRSPYIRCSRVWESDMVGRSKSSKCQSSRFREVW